MSDTGQQGRQNRQKKDFNYHIHSTFPWIFTSICHIISKHSQTRLQTVNWSTDNCSCEEECGGILSNDHRVVYCWFWNMSCILCSCFISGADHHLVHRLPEPHLLLVLRLPGRERCSRRQRLLRVWKLCWCPVVGGGKCVCVCVKPVVIVRGLDRSQKCIFFTV